MKKFRLLTITLILGLVLPVFGQISEYAVKAAYLFNFAKFVEWPTGTFQGETSPIIIGVLGEDPFGDDLDRIIEDKSVNGHSIRLKRFGVFDGIQIPQLRRCQILFIAYSEKDHLSVILQVLRGAPVLTVSEIGKFPLSGGMILFDQEGQRITLGINPKTAQRAQLKISSKLLHVAKIYKSE
ncbi:MAG TPA: YfiR family protein [bacterium]